MKKTAILMTILLVVAMVGALALVTQNQETRRGAAFANTTLFLLPNEKIVKKVGDEVRVQTWFQTENGAKVDGVQANVCYGNQLSLDPDSGVIPNAANSEGFNGTPVVVIKPNTSIGESCVTVVVTSIKPEFNLPSTGVAFTLNFTAISAGSGSITINKDKSQVTGDNSASATDKVITVTSVEGTTYEITGETATGDEPILNYEVAFGGVDPANAKCAVNWPMQMIVLSNGESKVYSGVKATSSTERGGKVIYKGSLPLIGFNHTSDVAVFIKGPKHLQMKYAVQNQSESYKKPGGELVLTKDAATSVVYNFSAYPMLPGDVVGATVDDGPNGEINGVDFAYVKNRPTHERVDDGGYLKADLSGNCLVETGDLTVLKVSLETKQGQLY